MGSFASFDQEPTLHRCLSYVARLQASYCINFLNLLLSFAWFACFRKVMDVCIRLRAFVGIDVQLIIIFIVSITMLTSSPRETHFGWTSPQRIVGVTFLPQPQDGFRRSNGDQEVSSCKCFPRHCETPILQESDQNVSKVCRFGEASNGLKWNWKWIRKWFCKWPILTHEFYRDALAAC
jgi:hypothetical protein